MEIQQLEEDLEQEALAQLFQEMEEDDQNDPRIVVDGSNIYN